MATRAGADRCAARLAWRRRGCRQPPSRADPRIGGVAAAPSAARRPHVWPARSRGSTARASCSARATPGRRPGRDNGVEGHRGAWLGPQKGSGRFRTARSHDREGPYPTGGPPRSARSPGPRTRGDTTADDRAKRSASRTPSRCSSRSVAAGGTPLSRSRGTDPALVKKADSLHGLVSHTPGLGQGLLLGLWFPRWEPQRKR